jgi:hypothetical protein
VLSACRSTSVNPTTLTKTLWAFFSDGMASVYGSDYGAAREMALKGPYPEQAPLVVCQAASVLAHKLICIKLEQKNSLLP